MGEVRKRIVFHGRVQGVGFRYRANYLARSLMLSGWVKNQWDGTVLMEVQGAKELVDKLLERLSTGSYIYVERMDMKDIPLKTEAGFYVR